MHAADWGVIGAYVLASVVFALFLAPRGHGSGDEYMVAGRRLPWWVLGIANVATSDGADAYWIYIFFVGGFIGYYRFYWLWAVCALPLLVLWARYWRRLSISSPGQIFEERYSGRAASGFRAFSAIYGALVSNAVLLGYVLNGFAESMAPFIGWPPEAVLLFFCGATLLYTLLSGLLGVAYSDIGHFALMMLGRVLLAAVLLSSLGGLYAVLDRVEAVRGAAFLSPYPPAPAGARFGEFTIDGLSMAALLLYGLFDVASTQSAPVQKALAARDERHAALGQLFSLVLSIPVRAAPLALIGLCAVAVFPAERHDTGLWADLVRRFQKPGLLGLLLVGIAAGYVSTIDGLLNFNASCVLNDVYRRHLRRGASQREEVLAGRVLTVLCLVAAYLFARVLIVRIDGAWINFINSVIWLFMLPLSMLRWVWWRMNIWGELAGFALSFPMAYLVWFGTPYTPAFKDRPYYQAFLILFGLGWGVILLVTLLTRAEPEEVLRSFYRRVRPPGAWGRIARLEGAAQDLPGAGDLVQAALAVLFCAALPVGLSAALSRRYGLLSLSCVAALGAALGLARAAARLPRAPDPR